MPWCPNCKAEYQPGYTVCSDCKIDLVEDIKEAENLIPFFQAEDQRVAEKLVKFFNYSDLQSTLEYNEEHDVYVVFIPPKKQQEAKRLYQAFYYVEKERLANKESELLSKKDDKKSRSNKEDAEDAETYATDSEEENDYTKEPQADSMDDEAYSENTPGDEINAFDETPEPTVYVMKADQYKDLTGTVRIFLLFGIAGLVVVLLNVIGVLHFFSGWIPNIVMGALFLFFLYVAISTNSKAKKVQAEIDAENKLTEQINDWLKAHFTKDFVACHRDENISDELNYIRITDSIKDMLIEEFGKQNLSYLDRLIEEYYSENF